MNIINIFSLILFILFLFSYVLNLIILKKKSGIKALVLAKGNKGKSINFAESLVRISTFLWGIIWLAESLVSNWVTGLLPNLFKNEFLNYLGLFTVVVGLSYFVLSMLFMKTSWRVGIDKNTKTKLITNGLYKYSRNPAFVGFDFMFIGLFLTFPNIVTLFISLLNIISIHLLILQEEKHLEAVFKEDYLIYKRKAPRYL